ncbi:kelch domain-containing protein 3-like [Amblyomma americanum]
MWTVKLNGIPERFQDMAVTIKGKVYSFDAFDDNSSDSDERDHLIDVYTFDPASYRWDIVPVEPLHEDEPINIMGCSVVAYGHCAYLWGGWNTSPVNFVHRFDSVAMTWSRPEVRGEVPRPQITHSACVLSQRMYIFGGLDTDSLNGVRYLDLETLEWHHVLTSGEAPDGRYWHTASAIGTRMYVWGGRLQASVNNEHYDNSLYYLETTTATWVRPHVQGVAPEGRECHSAFVYEKELYIFGGCRALTGTYFADMHKYDLEKSCWTKVTAIGCGPSARHSAGCSVLGERVLVFGGLGPLTNIEEEELTNLHVLHLAPTLKNLCLLAVIDAGLDLGDLPPLIRNEISTIISRSS